VAGPNGWRNQFAEETNRRIIILRLRRCGRPIKADKSDVVTILFDIFFDARREKMSDLSKKIQTLGQKLVSGDKYRYVADGYNLDLTYAFHQFTLFGNLVGGHEAGRSIPF